MFTSAFVTGRAAAAGQRRGRGAGAGRFGAINNAAVHYYSSYMRQRSGRPRLAARVLLRLNNPIIILITQRPPSPRSPATILCQNSSVITGRSLCVRFILLSFRQTIIVRSWRMSNVCAQKSKWQWNRSDAIQSTRRVDGGSGGRRAAAGRLLLLRVYSEAWH